MNTEVEFWKSLIEKDLQIKNRDIFIGYRIRGFQSRLSGFFLNQPISHDIFRKGIFCGRILDVGSGPISYFECHPQTKVIAIDPNINEYNQANSNIFKIGKINNVEYISGYVSNIPYPPPEKYDLIWCTNVLDHTKDFRQILEHFSRLISNSGVCMVQTDCRSPGNISPGHEGVFSKSALIKEVRQLGFHIYYEFTTRGFHGEDSVYLIFGKPVSFSDITNKAFYKYHRHIASEKKIHKLIGNRCKMLFHKIVRR